MEFIPDGKEDQRRMYRPQELLESMFRNLCEIMKS